MTGAVLFLLATVVLAVASGAPHLAALFVSVAILLALRIAVRS